MLNGVIWKHIQCGSTIVRCRKTCLTMLTNSWDMLCELLNEPEFDVYMDPWKKTRFCSNIYCYDHFRCQWIHNVDRNLKFKSLTKKWVPFRQNEKRKWAVLGIRTRQIQYYLENKKYNEQILKIGHNLFLLYYFSLSLSLSLVMCILGLVFTVRVPIFHIT